MKTSFLILMLLMTNISNAIDDENDPKNVKIESAYEDSKGRMIVYFDSLSDSTGSKNLNPKLMGSNLVFYGTEKNLYQLNQKEASGGDLGKSLTFESRLHGAGEFSTSIIDGKFKKATLKCEGESIDYKPVSKARLSKLQELVRKKGVVLNPIPVEKDSEAAHYTPCDKRAPFQSQPQKKQSEKNAEAAR